MACKGLFFRPWENFFCANGRIVKHYEMRLLKRDSCPGCSECEWIMKEMNSDIDGSDGQCVEIPDGANPNFKYKIEVVGDCDDYVYNFVEYR